MQRSTIRNRESIARWYCSSAHTQTHEHNQTERESESEPAPVEQHPNAPGHSSSSSTKKTIQIVKGIQYDIQQQQKQQQRTEPGRESKPILWSDPIRYDLRKFRSRRRRLNAVAGSFLSHVVVVGVRMCFFTGLQKKDEVWEVSEMMSVSPPNLALLLQPDTRPSFVSKGIHETRATFQHTSRSSSAPTSLQHSLF